MNNCINTILYGRVGTYEDATTLLQSNTLYSWYGYSFHVGNLLGNRDIYNQAHFLGDEWRNFIVTETLKTKEAVRISTVYLAGRGSQCVRDYKLQYLNSNGVYVDFYQSTLPHNPTMYEIPVPPGINTKSIRIVSLSYYSYGPGLSAFYFEYDYSCKVTATYDEGFTGVTISPENYNISDRITATPILKPGYDWVKWTGDVNSTSQILTFNVLSESMSIHANSKPGLARYTVNHYLMKTNGTEYDLEESETHDSITGTTVSCPVKTYDGFQSPGQQTITVKNDSSSVVNYYYTRNKYRITVQNGTSLKYEYWYQETGTLSFDRNSSPPLKTFKYWFSNEQVTIFGAFKKEATFLMPNYNVNFSVVFEDYTRLNSNIYKNIFPEEAFDLEYIEFLKDNTTRSYDEIKQPNHGLQVSDVVAYDSKKGYFKPVASFDTKNIRGIVSAVRNADIFTVISEGRLPYHMLSFTDSTILYLSDKIPGKLVHYKEIENTAYIPIAIYTDNSIIINILNGTFGTTLAPYEQPDTSENFEHYTQSELQEVIDAVMGG